MEKLEREKATRTDRPWRLYLCGVMTFLFVTHDAKALSLLNQVYAEDCQAAHPNQTVSFSFRTLPDGSIGRITKQADGESIWKVKQYKEDNQSLTVNYDEFTDTYRVQSDSIRLMSRLNTTGPNAYKFRVLGGSSVESKRETPTLARCAQTSGLSAHYGRGNQVAQATTPIQNSNTRSHAQLSAFANCAELHQSVLDNHYYARQDRNRYSAYRCEAGINSAGRRFLHLHGRPGTQSSESFVYLAGSSCIFYEHSNGVEKVYGAETFSEIGGKPNDADIETLCRSGFRGGDKEEHLLKYNSARGDCRSTYRLVEKAEKNTQKLELARLSARQGCNFDGLKTTIQNLEIAVSAEAAKALDEQKRQREFCARQVMSCRTATSLSRDLTESLARQLSVGVGTLNLNRLEIDSCGCSAVIYTPKGPINCTVHSIKNLAVDSASCR